MPAYETYHNARQTGDGGTLARKVVGNRGPFAFIPQLTSGIEDWAFYLNGGASYIASDFTETKTNSGTIGMVAGGLALVSGATSGNNTTAQLIRSILPATNKRFAFACRLQLTNIALGKAFFGFWQTQADPSGTAPTDGVWFSKDTAGTGVIKANMAGNNTAATAVTVTTLVNTTDVEFGLVYTPSAATAGKCDFYFRAADVEGWGAPTASITSAAGAGPQVALRPGFNITATSSAALTETVKWWGFAEEL